MLNVIALITPPDKYFYHLTLFPGLTRLASDYYDINPGQAVRRQASAVV
jgi:hypothetical protein